MTTNRRRVTRQEWQNALKAGDHGLKPETHHAAVTLLMWMDADGYCFPGQEVLALAMAKSSRSVREGVKGLDEAGWVQRIRGGRRGDQNISTRYLSTLPTGSPLPVGDACQTSGIPAGGPRPNRKPSVSQPEVGRIPTGSGLPTNSQQNSQQNSQEEPAANADSQSPESQGAASRRAAADADGRTREQINRDGAQAARRALQQTRYDRSNQP